MIMPVHNEDPRRVFAGVTAMRESLEQTGWAGGFHFFVLSDTTDPDIWAREEAAFAETRESSGLSSRLFYRRRPWNIEHKAGNIREFCERWGGRYKYMVVLDADSLMTGRTVVELGRRMEDDARIGILQVPIKLVNRHTLFARLLQFSSGLYGNVYRLGFSYWSRNEGNYWGHNAIVRIEAFTQCCRLPHLPGSSPLGGEILSHEFVEAAFMLRRGWKVVVAQDLGGSYEECPDNLVEYAKRDERWSQGNLQHLRLVTARGMNLVSRFHMSMGAMSYLASPLWGLFIILSWARGLSATASSSGAFSPREEHSLLYTILLPLSGGLALLLLIKLLAYLAAAFRRPEARQYGGAGKMGLSVILEIVVSLLLAPILMVYQTTFVINALRGRKVMWEAQRRDEARVGFAEAFRAHRLHTLVGLVIVLLMVVGGRYAFWWLLPVVAGLVFSAPFSVLLDSASVGRRLRRMGLLLSPQETNPPEVLQRRQALLVGLSEPSLVSPHPLARLIADPALLDLHISMLPSIKSAAAAAEPMDEMLSAALRLGAGQLRREDRLALMQDYAALQRLHRKVWQDWPVDELRAATGNGRSK